MTDDNVLYVSTSEFKFKTYFSIYLIFIISFNCVYLIIGHLVSGGFLFINIPTICGILFFLILYSALKEQEIKIYKDRIYCKNFKNQNTKLNIQEIPFNNIISASIVKVSKKERIEINSTYGKYYINKPKGVIPVLKKQLKDKWHD